jgi:hypothetical protein
MNIDFAILYFGLTRSTKQVYMSHIMSVYNLLDSYNLSYMKFMHTWRTNDNKQRVWYKTIEKEIDYTEYKLLEPDVYKIENQEDFLNSINMDNYFYKEVYERINMVMANYDPQNGYSEDGEWVPELITNHLCALESQKRCLGMLEEYIKKGYNFKQVVFLRPDVRINTLFPLYDILSDPDAIYIPNEEHHSGYNDRFAVMNYKNACIYGKRIDEIAEFRKTNGKIMSEKYVKYIIHKYNMNPVFIKFNFDLIRP